MTERLLGAEPQAVCDRLARVVGDGVLSMRAGVAVAEPSSDAEVSSLLRVCAEEGWRALPAGSRLGPGMASVGAGAGDLAKQGPDLVLSARAMNEVVEHEPGDLMVAAGAGVELEALQSAVSKERQWLALDPPGGGKVTLGGVVSMGLAGPLRAQYGRPRDHVLGLTLVDGAGRVLRLGGRVVKNVAGFDLVRLTAGSRGAVGMITQINWRLHPLPEADVSLVWRRADLSSAWQLGRSLVTLPIPVSAAELFSGAWPEPLTGDGPGVLLRVAGSSKAVAGVIDALLQKAGAPDRRLDGHGSTQASSAMSRALGELGTAFRLHLLPSRGADALEALERVPARRWALQLLNGTCRGLVGNGDAGKHLAVLAARAGELGGSFWVEESEGAVLTSRTVPRAAAASDSASAAKARVTAEILRTFDPKGILPGAWREGWLPAEASGATVRAEEG